MGKRMVLLICVLMSAIVLLAGGARAAHSTAGDTLAPQPLMVDDLNQTASSSNPGPFVVIEGVAYFFLQRTSITST